MITTKAKANILIVEDELLIAKNTAKKQVKPEKPVKPPKSTVKPQEKNDDDTPNDLQQQIGFDF